MKNKKVDCKKGDSRHCDIYAPQYNGLGPKTMRHYFHQTISDQSKCRLNFGDGVFLFNCSSGKNSCFNICNQFSKYTVKFSNIGHAHVWQTSNGLWTNHSRKIKHATWSILSISFSYRQLVTKQQVLLRCIAEQLQKPLNPLLLWDWN